MQRVGWRERIVVLGSLAAVVVTGALVGLLLFPQQTKELLGLVPVSMFAAGKFLPLWAVTGKSHFSPYELGLVIWFIDTASAVIWVYAFDALYRVPRFKRPLDRIQDSAQLVLEAYPRMRKAAVLGLILFVLFPVAGTGAMVGTFIGVLLGMRRGALIATVSAGGFLGGMLMALLTDHFAGPLIEFQNAQSDPMIKYGSMAVVGSVFLIGLWAMRRAYLRAILEAERRRQSFPHPMPDPD